MREDRRAELILSLVTTPERASATIGDLMEEMPWRGSTWFRLSTLRAAAGCVWLDLTALPLRMAGAAVVAWFGYMLVAALLFLVGHVLVSITWAVLYVLTHHTGFELLADTLRLKFQWESIPAVLRFTDTAAMIVIAPFYSGQIVAIEWRERAIAFSLVLTLVWPVMLTAVPFVGVFGERVTTATMPVVALFILVGVIRMRLGQIHETPEAETTRA